MTITEVIDQLNIISEQEHLPGVVRQQAEFMVEFLQTQIRLDAMINDLRKKSAVVDNKSFPNKEA